MSFILKVVLLLVALLAAVRLADMMSVERELHEDTEERVRRLPDDQQHVDQRDRSEEAIKPVASEERVRVPGRRQIGKADLFKEAKRLKFLSEQGL